MATGKPETEQGQEQNRTPLQNFLNAYEDAPFADTVLISASGERFKAYKGLLSKQSTVLKNMFENCDDPASSTVSKNGAFEVSLPDASAAIAVTMAYLQDSDGFWKAIKASRVQHNERFAALRNLLAFAHCYHMPGILERVDAFISEPVNLTHLIGRGGLFHVWSLVDNYYLKRSQQFLLNKLCGDPALFIDACNAGIPASVDHMRTAVILAREYANGMTGNAKERSSKLMNCVQQGDELIGQFIRALSSGGSVQDNAKLVKVAQRFLSRSRE